MIDAIRRAFGTNSRKFVRLVFATKREFVPLRVKNHSIIRSALFNIHPGAP